jgi:hypothetical protein
MATYVSPLDGHEETVRALPESKEWKRYMVELAEWQAKSAQLRASTMLDEMAFSHDYAVIAWRQKGTEDWIYNVPDDWEPDESFDRHGVDIAGDEKRILWIRLELMEFQQDIEALNSLAFPDRGDRALTPVTDKEVRAVLGSFQPDVGSAGGSVGGNTGARRGRQDRDVSVRGRDDGGRFARWARRLVRKLQGS